MIQYFKRDEFTCKCGCGKNNISSNLIEDLNCARHIANIPFVITSGCRCEAHNKTVGGLPSSAHLKGVAADIRADDSQERFKVLQALISVGFQRIGISKHFIHVDMDINKPQEVTWLY